MRIVREASPKLQYASDPNLSQVMIDLRITNEATIVSLPTMDKGGDIDRS